MKIDLKDKKILAALDRNCRQSYGELSKKVGLSKVAVMNRVKKLENNGIISFYMTIIDTMRLGYTTYDVYLKWRNTTPDKEREIIKYLKSHKQIWFIATCLPGSSVDIGILISTKTESEYYNVWEEIYSKISPWVDEVRTAVLIKYVHYTKQYLLQEAGKEKKEIYIGRPAHEKIDDIDDEILKRLARNAKISIVELSKATKLKPSSIIYRMKQLEKKNIIQGYRASINFQKLGYHYFKVMMNLNDLSKRKEIFGWIKHHPNITYLDVFIGGLDVEFDIEAQSTEEFADIIKELKKCHGSSIKYIEHIPVTMFHKSTYYPEEKKNS
jgi:Lrp/AsnC family transcriptional regulator, leucine-responsive regulatory protein